MLTQHTAQLTLVSTHLWQIAPLFYDTLFLQRISYHTSNSLPPTYLSQIRNIPSIADQKYPFYRRSKISLLTRARTPYAHTHKHSDRQDCVAL